MFNPKPQMADIPEITKARILYKRDEKPLSEATEHWIAAKKRHDELWLEYLRICKRHGFCGACEKPRNECECIIMANADQA